MFWFVMMPLPAALLVWFVWWLVNVLPRVRLRPITWSVVADWATGGGLPGSGLWKKKSPESNPSGPADS